MCCVTCDALRDVLCDVSCNVCCFTCRGMCCVMCCLTYDMTCDASYLMIIVDHLQVERMAPSTTLVVIVPEKVPLLKNTSQPSDHKTPFGHIFPNLLPLT